ncbi:MAG: hypothetical protein JNK04_00790 [Myxococcales bacterium]|nr:hypothetical protein [Myxococcales bacterium]
MATVVRLAPVISSSDDEISSSEPDCSLAAWALDWLPMVTSREPVAT